MSLQLRDYQIDAVQFATTTMLERDGAGLLQGCGLGKTVCSLYSLETLQHLAEKSAGDILITAPVRVVSHWLAEHKAWNINIPIRAFADSPNKRQRQLAENFRGISLLSHNLLPWYAKWLAKRKKTAKFPEVLVFDEGSKFRNWSGIWSQAGQYLAKRSNYRLVLTGTPAPNHNGEIFAQQYLLDVGKTLGTEIGSFRAKFMYRGGYENREWLFDEQKTDRLQELIKPYYLSQPASRFLQLPELVTVRHEVTLPPEIKREYARMQKDLIAELQSTKLVALSGSDRYRYCRQLASGMFYSDKSIQNSKTRPYVLAHAEKLKVLEDLLSELDGPVMVAYQYSCEGRALNKHFAKYPTATIEGGTSAAETDRIISELVSGQIQILFVQSQSISHGVNGLQHGCHHLIWFTLPDSSETYDQLVARLQRTGQTKPVIVGRLESVGTIDRAIYRMVQNKLFNQEELLKGLEDG